jgi:succinyl-CoA synthetase beta subunit
MNVHEYQGKELLARYGVKTPGHEVITSADQVDAAAKRLGCDFIVVKAQIHAGGRGAGALVANPAEAAAVFHANLEKEGLPKHDKKGGVQLTKNLAETKAAVDAILGQILVTKQTGPNGRTVQRVLLQEGCDLARELYLSVLLDRATGRVTMMASTEGGMEIETVAEETPERIFRVDIDPVIGLGDWQARELAFRLGLPKEKVNDAGEFFKKVYAAYVDSDASMIEINPLVQEGDGSLLVLDAKISFDDNAMYRHPDIRELRDDNEEDPKELRAAEFDLSYIALDGNIGCMVNGAGLAMATMDIIHYAGGEPANFCDVGGGATTEKVAEAFKIILSDENVKAVFINIFGGIMKCDVLAEGVVAASKQVGVKVPLVVRLEGTNVDKGRKIIAESGLDIITASDMLDGAKRAVAAAKVGA